MMINHQVKMDLNQSIFFLYTYNMPTVKQLIRNARQPIRNPRKSAALKGCPQRRGTCARVYVRLVQIMTSNK
jgi:small subunit ribosomal protein S12